MISTSPENRTTVFARALAFFQANPDELLTRSDLAVKFDCNFDTACLVAKALIREGVPRDQLPRDDKRVEQRKRRDARPFPHNLAPAEIRAVEGVMKHGTPRATAIGMGYAYGTLDAYLKQARRKAGVQSTALLVQCFKAAQVAA